jgi:hypothetical protein
MSKRYGFGSAIFDVTMCCITGGFWLIWIAIRFMRSNTKR